MPPLIRSQHFPEAAGKVVLPLSRLTPKGASPLTLVLGHDGSGAARLESAGANNNIVAGVASGLWDVPLEFLPGDFLPPSGVVTEPPSLSVLVRGRVDGVPNVGATVDLELRVLDRNGGAGADIVTTAAQSLSTSWQDRSFACNVSSIELGQCLSLVVVTNVDDTGGGGTIKAEISEIALIFTNRG